MERNTVPFSIGTTVEDMMTHVTARGVVRLEDDGVVVEYQENRRDMATMETDRSPVRTVRIPLDQIESMEVGRRWPWGSRLVIRTRSLSTLEGVPGVDGNEARVRIRRRDHDRARELCVSTSLLLTGEDIRRLEGRDGLAGA